MAANGRTSAPRRRPRPGSAPPASDGGRQKRSDSRRARPTSAARQSRGNSPGGHPPSRVVLEITVDIAPGRADVISVRKGDHAHELAKEFVERNRLAAKVIDPLTDHIKGHLTQLRRDETLAARQQRGRSAEPARPVSARRSRSRSRSRAQSPSPPSHHTFKPAI